MEGGDVVEIGKRKQHGFNGVLLIEVGTRASKAMEGKAEGEKHKYIPRKRELGVCSPSGKPPGRLGFGNDLIAPVESQATTRQYQGCAQ